MHDKGLKICKFSELLQSDSKEVKFFTASGMSAIKWYLRSHTETHRHTRTNQCKSEAKILRKVAFREHFMKFFLSKIF